jgi:hypothetical protein
VVLTTILVFWNSYNMYSKIGFKDMYSKMIPTLPITMYRTYSTQCTVRDQYPIPLSVSEGSRIPWKFKEEFNSHHLNPHVISFNIQSLECLGRSEGGRS